MDSEQSRLVSMVVDALEWGTDDEFRQSLDALRDAIRDVNKVDPAGFTLLHSVAFAGISDVRGPEELARIRVLLEAGCDPNIPDRNLVTPICRVAQGQDLAFLQLLIEFGANPCLEDQRGESAVVWATRITPINCEFFGALLEAAKRFSSETLPNADWLEDRIGRMAEPHASPHEQVELVDTIRQHYPDFFPDFKAKATS